MSPSRNKVGTILGVFAIVTAGSSSSPAATIRDDQPDSSYVSLANNPEFASVGLFVNSFGLTGCATLIAPDWILTAAHNLIAATSGTFTLGGVAYSSTQVIGNPGWNGNGFNGYDFGLVHLSSPVTNVAPAELYTDSLQPVWQATYVGFGYTGTGLTGWKTLDGQKRAFNNLVDDDFGTPTKVVGSDFDNPNSTSDNRFGSPTPLTLEGCVAPGDSGGGVFVTVNSRTYLAGVISFVAATDGNANASYGDVSGFGLVSFAMPWINSSIPEPSGLALSLSLASFFILGRFLRDHRPKR